MSANTNLVRIATRTDEPEVIRLLHMMHAESGIGRLDENCARQTFNRAFDRQGGIIGVIGAAELEAMIYLLITRSWYTLDPHLEELFNFVSPEHRKGTHYADALIEFAKECAVEIKIPLLIGVFTNSRMAGKVRLYRQHLGYPAGAFFVHNAVWQSDDVKPAGEDFWRDRPFDGVPRGGQKNREKRERRTARANGGAS